jgi:hypothetical protein
MLDRLIDITNSKDFTEDGHIAIKEVVARQREFDLRIIFELQNIISEIVLYECEIYCESIAYTTSHRLHEFKRPYNRISLYHNHPVLWNYENSQYLKLKGPCSNIAELMGDLFIAHDKACGNWVDFHWLFCNLPEHLNTQNGATVEVPERLLNTYNVVFDKHKITHSIVDVRKGSNGYSVLLFGNPDISPDNYNFGQPYIVAEKFTEILKEINQSP